MCVCGGGGAFSREFYKLCLKGSAHDQWEGIVRQLLLVGIFLDPSAKLSALLNPVVAKRKKFGFFEGRKNTRRNICYCVCLKIRIVLIFC